MPGGRKAVGLRLLLLLLPSEAVEVLLYRLHLRLQRLLQLRPHLHERRQHRRGDRRGRHRLHRLRSRWCFSDALEAQERTAAEQNEEVQSTGETSSQTSLGGLPNLAITSSFL